MITPVKGRKKLIEVALPLEAINASPRGLMRCRAFLGVIIVHDQASVNDSWNPAEQSQNEAKKETGNATGHKHGQRRQHHAEKISQRFHLELFRFLFALLFRRCALSA